MLFYEMELLIDDGTGARFRNGFGLMNSRELANINQVLHSFCLLNIKMFRAQKYDIINEFLTWESLSNGLNSALYWAREQWGHGF